MQDKHENSAHLNRDAREHDQQTQQDGGKDEGYTTRAGTHMPPARYESPFDAEKPDNGASGHSHSTTIGAAGDTDIGANYPDTIGNMGGGDGSGAANREPRGARMVGGNGQYSTDTGGSQFDGLQQEDEFQAGGLRGSNDQSGFGNRADTSTTSSSGGSYGTSGGTS